MSVLVDGNGEHPPEPRDETAIQGAGPTNSLVVVLRALFTWHPGVPNIFTTITSDSMTSSNFRKTDRLDEHQIPVSFRLPTDNRGVTYCHVVSI